MTRQLRVHRIDTTKTTPQEREEIRQFIEAIFQDRAHTLSIRNMEKDMLIYLRIEGHKRPQRDWRKFKRTTKDVRL